MTVPKTDEQAVAQAIDARLRTLGDDETADWPWEASLLIAVTEQLRDLRERCATYVEAHVRRPASVESVPLVAPPAVEVTEADKSAAFGVCLGRMCKAGCAYETPCDSHQDLACRFAEHRLRHEMRRGKGSPA